MFYSHTLFCVVSSFLLANQNLVDGKKVFEKVYYDLDLAEDLFQNYISEFQKHYTNDEFEHRFQTFQNGLQRINELNKKWPSTVFGLNKFTDMTPEELKAITSCVYNTSGVEQEEIPDIEPPENIDYRKQNLVTDIKDQLNCGSCYIFGAMGDIEGQHAKNHKELIALAEQYPLDCNKDFDCFGGYPEFVGKWLSTTSGAVRTKDYPYVGRKVHCRNNETAVAKVKGARKSAVRTVEVLKKIVADHGPLAMAMIVNDDMFYYQSGVFKPLCDASSMIVNDDMFYYQSGVFKPLCDASIENINHAMVIVGYSEEKYWIIKNSWGTKWGEDGYVNIDFDNDCEIGSYLSPSEVY